MVDTAGSVTSSNIFKDIGSGNLIKPDGDAANNIQRFNRRVDPSQHQGKDTPGEGVSEEQANIYEEKSNAFNEQFSATQADGDAEVDNPLGWGAQIEHEDIEALQDSTNKLATEFISNYSSSGHKVKESKQAEDLSKMLITLSWKSEAEPEALRKTQNSAYRVVSSVLEDMPRGGLDADLKSSVIDLFNPATNDDPNLKARKLLNFIKDAGPEELAKRNSKVYKKIEKAFNVKVGGEPFTDPEGNSIGKQVVDLVKMYVDPIISNVQDTEAEMATFDEKGKKAIQEIRTQILDAAISQAKDNKRIMGKLGKEVEVSFGDQTKKLGTMEDGTSYKEFAEQRIELIKDYFLDPSATKRKSLVENYAKFSSEMAKASQKAEMSHRSLDLLRKLSRNRKFDNLVLVPPELVKASEAKESLTTLFNQKIERIRNLETMQASKASESVSSKELKAAANEFARKIAAGTDSGSFSELGGSPVRKDQLQAIANMADNVSFADAAAFEADTSMNSATVTVDPALKTALFNHIKQKQSTELVQVMREEKADLLTLLGESGTAASTTTTYTVDINALKTEVSGAFGGGLETAINNVLDRINRDNPDLINNPEELKNQLPTILGADAGYQAAMAAANATGTTPVVLMTIIGTINGAIDNNTSSSTSTTPATRYTTAQIDAKTADSLNTEASKVTGLTGDLALARLRETGTYSYKVISKGDDISELKQRVTNLNRLHNRELAHLKGVRKDMNKLLQDNFTRGGIYAVNKSVAHAFESMFVEDGTYTGDGEKYLEDFGDNLLEGNNNFVTAMQTRKSFLETQKADAYSRILDADYSNVAGQTDIKDQIAQVLGTAVAASDKDAIAQLKTAADNAYGKTKNNKFLLTPEMLEVLEKPNFRDPTAFTKQQLVARQVLLNYMYGINNLTNPTYRDNPDLQNQRDRIRDDLGLTQSQISTQNDKLANAKSDVDKVYDREIESVSKEWLPDNIGKANTVGALLAEEKDMETNRTGGKSFFSSARNFVQVLLSDFVNSIAAGRKDAARDYMQNFTETHDEAFADAREGNPYAEEVSLFMSSPNPDAKSLQKRR